MASVGENVDRLTNLRGCPAIIIGDHDVGRGRVRTEELEECEEAHRDSEARRGGRRSRERGGSREPQDRDAGTIYAVARDPKRGSQHMHCDGTRV